MRVPGQILICFVILSLVINAECTTNILMALMKLMHPPPTHPPMSMTCKPNCCKSMKCPKMKCMPHQKMKPHAGWCGCCPKCMTQLKEGASCHPKPMHPKPMMPSSECGCSMKCKKGKCCK